MTDWNIPADHWNWTCYDQQLYVPSWEMQLRAAIRAQPDPLQRFSDWLKDKTVKPGCYPPPRLAFLEQPYLGWAEAVESAIEAAKKDLRSQIAAQITNPEE